MSRKLTAFGIMKRLAIAVATTAFANAATADSVRLVRPSQAESLHSDGVGMTVYYLGHSSPLEVVATFGERKSELPASQLRMSLADGDNIDFQIPGRPDVSFNFVRSGSQIEVRSSPTVLGSAATN